MFRRFFVLALAMLFLAVPLLAQKTTESRVERQQLLRELLKVIDSRRLTLSMLNGTFGYVPGTRDEMRRRSGSSASGYWRAPPASAQEHEPGERHHLSGRRLRTGAGGS
jgi:hypothetical protein